MGFRNVVSDGSSNEPRLRLQQSMQALDRWGCESGSGLGSRAAGFWDLKQIAETNSMRMSWQ